MTSFTDDTRCANVAPHTFCQHLRNAKSQPTTSETSGGAFVPLGEGTKKQFEVIRLNTDASVLYVKIQAI